MRDSVFDENFLPRLLAAINDFLNQLRRRWYLGLIFLLFLLILIFFQQIFLWLLY
jgi:hypothetical protein